MSSSFLEIENLNKNFGGLGAVACVTFNVKREEIVGLIGPNGAGKTTLMRLIGGILKPTSGTIRFKGEDITGLKTSEIVNKGIALTFQVVKPFRGLPVLTNVLVAALCPRARKKENGLRQQR